ncbi:MAG TPA: HEAT repeat domain-containing protein [Kofleriaceae bacterium]|nr:HEAT repeat domain-containing protein [Kofleriaceae bacterium]
MRSFDLGDLRDVVTDPAELAKGAVCYDEGGLEHFARHGDKLYADALGSSAAPYKVQVTIKETSVSARCSCMAARSRPFCKHAAALLVAWARAPEQFVVSDAPPVPPDEKKKRIKRGSADAKALMADGVAKAIQLARDLAAAGVAAREARPRDELRALADALRAGRLRRLAVRVHELADLLDAGAAAAAGDYADLLVDLLLTARKIEKHVEGEDLDPRHVEELIGKTWRKTDRADVERLDLVEYAYRAWETADGFVVRESRYVDLITGGHWSEKQIVPLFMARRTPAKPSRAGVVMIGASGGAYPGYPPVRLDLADPGDPRALDGATLARLVDVAAPDAATVVRAFQEHRKDLFAPDELPVALRAATVVADGPRPAIVDAGGLALPLAADAVLVDQLAAVLRGAELRAVLGDLGLDLALLVLVPRALVVERAGALELWPVAGTIDLASLRAKRRAPPRVIDPNGTAASAVPFAGPQPGWVDQARAAGASGAAIALAEVRGELADLLAQGLSRVTPRATDALVARLRDLGLARPAELLAELAARPDPNARLDDLVRVYQVLGVALVRLLSARTIDTSAHAAVPCWPSVRITRPAPLPEGELAAARDQLDRFHLAYHAGRAFEALDSDALARSPFTGDAELGPILAATLATRPGATTHARALLGKGSRIQDLTAIRALALAEPPAALDAFMTHLSGSPDNALKNAALQIVDTAIVASGPDEAAAKRRRDRRRVIAELSRLVLGSADSEARSRAARAMGEHGDPLAAGAPLRAAIHADPDDDVRAAAALALGRLGDPDTVGELVRELRAGAPALPARAVAEAVAISGDAYGLALLVDKLASGWNPNAAAGALALAKTAALPPLLDAIDRDPALAKRKTIARLVHSLAGARTGHVLARRLTRANAQAYLALAGAADPDARRTVALAILDVLADAAGDDRDARALARTARRVVDDVATGV